MSNILLFCSDFQPMGSCIFTISLERPQNQITETTKEYGPLCLQRRHLKPTPSQSVYCPIEFASDPEKQYTLCSHGQHGWLFDILNLDHCSPNFSINTSLQAEASNIPKISLDFCSTFKIYANVSSNP